MSLFCSIVIPLRRTYFFRSYLVAIQGNLKNFHGHSPALPCFDDDALQYSWRLLKTLRRARPSKCSQCSLTSYLQKLQKRCTPAARHRVPRAASRFLLRTNALFRIAGIHSCLTVSQCSCGAVSLYRCVAVSLCSCIAVSLCR